MRSRAKPLPIYGDGGNVRDWLYVEDHCAGIGAGPGERQAWRRNTISAEEMSGQICRSWITLCAVLDELSPPASNQALASKGTNKLQRSEDFCRRSAGPRPALRDRFNQDPKGAWLASKARFRVRFEEDRPLVSRTTATGAQR